jgi:hypothetical protein
MSILEHFVGVPRPGQVRALQAVASNWSKSDVFVIRADVGEGKSKIAECILRWVASARSRLPEQSGVVAVPNNVLLDQYLAGCKGLDTLRRKDLYACHEGGGRTCAERAEQMGACCKPADGNCTGLAPAGTCGTCAAPGRQRRWP